MQFSGEQRNTLSVRAPVLVDTYVPLSQVESDTFWMLQSNLKSFIVAPAITAFAATSHVQQV